MLTRLIVWLAGLAGFYYAIDRFCLWREAVALATLAAAFLWLVGGGLWAFAGAHSRARRGNIPPADVAAYESEIIRLRSELARKEAAK